MAEEIWIAVDSYLTGLFIGCEGALDGALSDSAAAGLPAINVTPPQGKLLHLLAKMLDAKRVLELGTLGGYSTIWLARALPAGGRLVTVECDPKHAAVAEKNFERAGLIDKIDLRIGKAIEVLPQLAAEGAGPFDLVFIDADKPSTVDYFQWALKLTRPGSVIVVDNVIRDGKVIDATSPDPSVQGIRRFNDLLAKEQRVSATAIQTVGSKGYDGFAIARVNSER